MKIFEAKNTEELGQIAELFRAYNDFLVSKGITGNLSGIDREIEDLPGPYASGVLLLAKDEEGVSLGCVALKKRTLKNGEVSAELKRLYITPAARGTGAGRALMQASIDWARAHGFASVVLDTHPTKMPEAMRLYESMGFEYIEGFNDNPVPNIVYFRLGL